MSAWLTGLTEAVEPPEPLPPQAVSATPLDMAPVVARKPRLLREAAEEQVKNLHMVNSAEGRKGSATRATVAV
ncbi:hypothetical protein ACWD0J_34805 [Streptomyces sp. NPDC003011]